MSESESEPGGIHDEDLPEDLQPGEDNPLAEPLDTDEVDREDLDLQGGKPAEEADDDGGNGDGDDGDGDEDSSRQEDHDGDEDDTQ